MSELREKTNIIISATLAKELNRCVITHPSNDCLTSPSAF